MSEGEVIMLLDEGASFKKWEFHIGTARYRVIAFDDGSFRVWDVATIRPTGANSMVLSPYFSEAAREMAREEDPDTQEA